MTRSPAFTYAFYIIAMFAMGFTTAYFFQPGDWYDALAKPEFNPPNWVFGPVWTLLYVLIGISGAKVALSFIPGGMLGLWWLQWVLNGAWTAAFFGAQMIGVALIVILFLLAVIIAYIVSEWEESKTASLLFVPYAAWVAFATALNATIWWMN